jgi:hypothetical protein
LVVVVVIVAALVGGAFGVGAVVRASQARFKQYDNVPLTLETVDTAIVMGLALHRGADAEELWQQAHRDPGQLRETALSSEALGGVRDVIHLMELPQTAEFGECLELALATMARGYGPNAE